MLKIIIPIAGSSELFEKAGYFYPKPLIEIQGKIMIQWVIEKISPIPYPHQFIFIIKEEDAVKFHLDNTLRLLSPDCNIVKLKKNTKGGLCSVLMAIDIIEQNDSIIIMNSDQVIDGDFIDILNFWKKERADAGMLTFKSVHPRWSYVRIEDCKVVQTAEKNPISNDAIAGFYFFLKASEFFESSFKTILKDVQLNGNFYISSVMNEYVLQNKTVLHYPIDKAHYHSFYSPQLIKEFEDFKFDNKV